MVTSSPVSLTKKIKLFMCVVISKKRDYIEVSYGVRLIGRNEVIDTILKMNPSAAEQREIA